MNKKSILWLFLLGISIIAAPTSADIFGTGENQFTIDFVTISGDTNPTSGYGIVENDYRMGVYEITNDQWNRFTNEYGPVTGSPPEAYDVSRSGAGTMPISAVSWFEAAQFVNWLNTSTSHQAAYKFTGTQGTGDYTFDVWQPGDIGYDADNPFRNSDAYYFLPTEDEWVKATYWNGTKIQDYATTDGSKPVAGVDAKYDNISPYGPWDVGSGSEELNGTFDMMGNVWEWNESPFGSHGYVPDTSRSLRGGAYWYTAGYLVSFRGIGMVPFIDYIDIGFRVASMPVLTNTQPVANAGQDQVVYPCADDLALVKLDGSGSYDEDGDELTYLWSWIVDSNEITATGVDPNVSLPVGEHTIELIVNDGTEDSEPNDVVITVIGPVEADVHIVPRVISRNNHLKRVMAIIRLPEGIRRQDIADEPFVLCADETGESVEASWQRVLGWHRRPTVFALFDKDEVMAQLPDTGRVELTITGKLTSGQCISGSDTVRIIRPRQRLRSRIRR